MVVDAATGVTMRDVSSGPMLAQILAGAPPVFQKPRFSARTVTDYRGSAVLTVPSGLPLKVEVGTGMALIGAPGLPNMPNRDWQGTITIPPGTREYALTLTNAND